MSRRRSPKSLLLSLSELAWVVVFAIMLMATYQNSEGKRALERAEDRIREVSLETWNLRMAQFSSRIVRLPQHLLGMLYCWRHQMLGIWLYDRLCDLRREFAEASQELRAATSELNGVLRENERLAHDLSREQDEVRRLQGELKSIHHRIKGIEDLLTRAEQPVDRASTDLETRIEVLRRRLLRLRELEMVERRELLGIQGELRNVVLVVDHSSSMAEDDRWQHTQRVVRNWLENLYVDRAALVLFSGDVTRHPPQGYLELTGAEGVRNRERLVSAFDAARPAGLSDMRGALEIAFGYPEVDTVILFSDGRPGRRERGQDRARRAVLELCKQKESGVQLNSVGVGHYFRESAGEFLRELAESNGGVFIGR